MGRTLDQVIAGLPPGRRRRVEAHYRKLRQEVEGLRELRRIAGKAQAEVATALSIRQPSVSKIERQADMYLSTLRSYVEAIGGKLELVVHLPPRLEFRLQNLGDLAGAQDPVKRSAKPAGGRPAVPRHAKRGKAA